MGTLQLQSLVASYGDNYGTVYVHDVQYSVQQ